MSAGYAGRADAGLPFLSSAAQRFQAGLAAYNLREHRRTIVGIVERYFEDSSDIVSRPWASSVLARAREGDMDQAYHYAALLENFNNDFARYVRSSTFKSSLVTLNARVNMAHNNCVEYYRGMSIDEILQNAIRGKISEKTGLYKYGSSVSANWDTSILFSRPTDSAIAAYEKRSVVEHSMRVPYNSFSSILPKTVQDITNDPGIGAHWAHMIESRIPIGTPVWTRNSRRGVRITSIYIEEGLVTSVGKQKVKEAAWLLGAEVIVRG